MSLPDPARDDIRALARRVAAMDRYGTRPLAKISADLAQLKREFHEHEKRSEQRRKERVTGRRWVIGTCIAVGVLMTAVLALLVQILAVLHTRG